MWPCLQTPPHLLIFLRPKDRLKAAVEHFSCGQPKGGQCGVNKETSHVKPDLVKDKECRKQLQIEEKTNRVKLDTLEQVNMQ